MDFNESFIEMEQEIQNLSKLTKTANDTVADLKSELSDKDYVITEQHSNITRLQSSVDRNEAYSRSNLIFGGISKDVKGSCPSKFYCKESHFYHCRYHNTSPNGVR